MSLAEKWLIIKVFDRFPQIGNWDDICI